MQEGTSTSTSTRLPPPILRRPTAAFSDKQTYGGASDTGLRQRDGHNRGGGKWLGSLLLLLEETSKVSSSTPWVSFSITTCPCCCRAAPPPPGLPPPPSPPRTPSQPRDRSEESTWLTGGPPPTPKCADTCSVRDKDKQSRRRTTGQRQRPRLTKPDENTCSVRDKDKQCPRKIIQDKQSQTQQGFVRARVLFC